MKLTSPLIQASPFLQLHNILIGETCPPTHNIANEHYEVIHAFAELYFLLHDLAVISPQSILGQPSVAGEFFYQARREGHSEEGIALMAAMYELDVFIEIEPSTVPMVTDDREMLGDGTYQIPPHAVRLTHQIDGHGHHMIYDLSTKMMTHWDPMTSDDEGPEPEPGIFPFQYLTQHPVREVIGPLIEKWRTLEFLATPSDYIDFWPDMYQNSGRNGPEDLGGLELQLWETGYDHWAAVRGIKDIYLECGWDVDNHDEQLDFNRDEFLGKRGMYWEQVVVPLADEEHRIWEEKMEQDRIANAVLLRQMDQAELEGAEIDKAAWE